MSTRWPLMHRHALPLLVITALLTVGCVPVEKGIARFTIGSSEGGRMEIESRIEEQTVLRANFETVIYSYDTHNNVTVLLVAGDLSDPEQVAVVRMLWRPRAAKTPLASTATNATVNYVIFAGDNQIGIYAGAGYMEPPAAPGDDSFGAYFKQGTLRLQDASKAFRDRLGPSNLSGTFVARRDDNAIAPALRQLSARVRDRLGYPRLVDGKLTDFDHVVAMLIEHSP